MICWHCYRWCRWPGRFRPQVPGARNGRQTIRQALRSAWGCRRLNHHAANGARLHTLGGRT